MSTPPQPSEKDRLPSPKPSDLAVALLEAAAKARAVGRGQVFIGPSMYEAITRDSYLNSRMSSFDANTMGIGGVKVVVVYPFDMVF